MSAETRYAPSSRDTLAWKWQECAECLSPCELHGISQCPTCHKHTHECGYGSCLETAEQTFRWPHESRAFCHKHATDPAYGWLRAGSL